MIDLDRHLAVRPAPIVRCTRLIATAIVVLGFQVVAARPASAHEIAVAVLIAAAEDSGTDSAAVIDGLRLAIDQSPDVGHAAGSDAGDHLGGVDVELAVVDDLKSPVEAGDAARRVVADGASVVVVLGDSASIREAAAGVVPGRAFPVAVFVGPGEPDPTLTMPTPTVEWSQTMRSGYVSPAARSTAGEAS